MLVGRTSTRFDLGSTYAHLTSTKRRIKAEFWQVTIYDISKHCSISFMLLNNCFQRNSLLKHHQVKWYGMKPLKPPSYVAIFNFGQRDHFTGLIISGIHFSFGNNNLTMDRYLLFANTTLFNTASMLKMIFRPAH